MNKTGRDTKIRKLLNFFLLLAVTQVCGQLYPVNVNMKMVPPYSVRLSEYTTSIRERMYVDLSLFDVNDLNRKVRLKLIIKRNNQVLCASRDFVAGAPDITLDGGLPLTLTNLDLAPYFRFENLQGISLQVYNNPLPDGYYQFCFEVYDFNTGRLFSKPGCDNVHLVLYEPPVLNLPRPGDIVSAELPQNIFFTWTPRGIPPSGATYEFTLKELWDTQIDPRAAFQASPELYRTTTFDRSLLYDQAAPQLIDGKTYGWQVRAMTGDGIEETRLFKNNGYSEIFWFTYLSDCSPPDFILAEAISTNSERITWNPNIDHLAYRVQYRKVAYKEETEKERERREKRNKRRAERGKDPIEFDPEREDYEWYEVNSRNPFATIHNLETGTTYEYRVGGQCHFGGGFSYSDPQEFTTATKGETTYYNCGLIPEVTIDNRDPLQNLGVNETFTAGDFPVTVKEVRGANGRYSGWGFIVVPYLGDTKIRVVFNDIQINTDYQLVQGEVETAYDADWGDVVDQEEVVETIEEIPDLIGDLATIIADLFKKREEELKNLRQLQDDLASGVITQEEFDKQAEQIGINVKAIDEHINGSIKDEVIDSPYATEEQKEAIKELEPTALADNNDLSKTDVDAITEKDTATNAQIQEIANEVAKQKKDAENYLFSILMAMKVMDGDAYLKCKECESNTGTVSGIGESGRFSGRIGPKLLTCILGTIESGEPKEPSKFIQTAVTEEEQKILENEFKTLQDLVLNKQEGFLVISKKDNDLLECNTPLNFEAFCTNDSVSDTELKHLAEELQQCNPTNITDVHSILVSLNKQIRSNQQIEWATEDKVYILNENGQVETVSLTDEQIENGEWTNTDIDQIFRVSKDEDGVLQFKAAGIRKNLSIFDGKTADLKSLSRNMKVKGNAFLSEFQVRNVDDTPEKKGANLDSDAFADGKKIAIKEDATFIKIISEGAGKMGTLLKTGAVEESTYLESTEPTEVVHAPGVVTGSTEAATRAVTDITGVVVLVYDLSVDTEARKQTWQGLKKVKDQIADEPSALFPILTEIIVEETTGNTPEDWAEITGEGTDYGRKGHLTTKGAVRTGITIFTSGKLILKLPEMADDLAAKMLDVKLWEKFKKAEGFAESMLTTFKKNLNELLEKIPEAAESLSKIADFASARELADLVAKMNKLKEVPGLDKVIADMGQYWSKFRGGIFQLDYAEQLLNSGKKISFEVSDLSDDLKRIYDITYDSFEKGRTITKRLELKNWNNFYPATIKSQLVKDLAKMENLGEIQWIFNKTDNISDLSKLKDNVLQALKKADGSAVDELDNIPLDKVDDLFGDYVDGITQFNKSEKILEALEDDTLFDLIFEIAD